MFFFLNSIFCLYFPKVIHKNFKASGDSFYYWFVCQSQYGYFSQFQIKSATLATQQNQFKLSYESRIANMERKMFDSAMVKSSVKCFYIEKIHPILF